MGLFDDILKKPANIPMPPADPLSGITASGQGSITGGSTAGAGDDGSAPVIIKTESATVFGPQSEAEALKASLPPEPTVHAEEDYSSVLVTSTSTTPEVSTPIAPVVASIPTPSLTTPVSPVLTHDVTATEPTPEPVSLDLPQGPSLFDHIMSDTPVPASSSESTAVISPLPAPAETSSIFAGFTPEPAVTSAPVEETISTPAVESVVTPSVSLAADMSQISEPHGDFSTPREFIEKSLGSIALMLGNIEKRHEAKKEEERGYREEKMRFAELEKNAYIEAEIMDRERDHALRMQSMFQAELDTDTANREKKVHHTESRHEDKHTKKRHEEEEESIIAS